MKVADFGRFDAPLVLFGGIYSNLQAFFALTEAAGAREMICTSDIASPADSIERRFPGLSAKSASGMTKRINREPPWSPPREACGKGTATAVPQVRVGEQLLAALTGGNVGFR